MANSFVRDLQDFAYGLTNLEINTITKDGMTARKMPILPHALLDIVEKYVDFFGKIGLDYDAMVAQRINDRSGWTAVFAERRTYSSRKVDASADTFDRIRWAAAAALKPGAYDLARNANVALTEDDRVVLARVRRNCDQLKSAVTQLLRENAWKNYVGDTIARETLIENLVNFGQPPLPPPDILVLVRKIWDIGDEIVEMQTVLQLDGDVITRIRSGLTAADRMALLPLHERSIDVSARHWATLFDLIGALTGSLANRVFGPAPGK